MGFFIVGFFEVLKSKPFPNPCPKNLGDEVDVTGSFSYQHTCRCAEVSHGTSGMLLMMLLPSFFLFFCLSLRVSFLIMSPEELNVVVVGSCSYSSHIPGC